MSFQGKWDMTDAGNMDEFMVKLGVAPEIRERINKAKPSLDITIDGDNVMYKTISGGNERKIPFKFGVEFETTAIDGKPVKGLVVRDSDTKWSETQQSGDGAPRKVIRELVGDEMVITIEAAGNTCVVKYKRA